MEETKTNLRKKLEQYEDDIHKSWLKDLDKTREMLELIEILTEMEKEEYLENFLTNSSDLEYFLKKFTKEVTSNILRQTFVYGENGDDIALKLLNHFLRIFLKFNHKPEYSCMFEFIRDIFDSNKTYYKLSFYGNCRILNAKKLTSADKYNESLPRKNDSNNKYEIGQELDVLIENKKSHNLGDKRVWVRGILFREEGENYVINIAESGVCLQNRKTSFDIAPKGVMTKDYDWRTTLKQWDVIDCYDRGRWYPSTVLSVHSEVINDLPKVIYKIGFRLYPDKFADWKSFTKYWNDRNFSSDSSGKKYIGDAESMDEHILYYSKRIQKFNTFINSESAIYTTKALSDEYDSFFIDEFIPFEHEGSKNFIIGRGNNFSYYYALLLKQFAEMEGFIKLSQILKSGKAHAELVHTIFHIFLSTFSYFHKDYIQIVSEEITKNAFSYIKELNINELRNIKKDTLDLIIKVLKCYLSVNNSIDERNKIIEDFSISSSIRMLKTTFLDKRIQAIKNIVDVINAKKYEKNKSQDILKLIEDNQLFNEIYGPNTHIQLINRSKELLEIMVEEDRLSDAELDLIWAATKKGDLEGKLTILKTLKEISRSLKKKHVHNLLENAYSDKNSGEDLINEEIELIYELSTLNDSDEEDVKKCISHFTKCLFNSKNDDGIKINALIVKICDAIVLFPKFKQFVISSCISNIEKNQFTILTLKLLGKYLSDYPLRPGDETVALLFKDGLLINIFLENFQKYKKVATDLSKKLLNNNIDAAEMIHFENFSHIHHIKIRLEFLQILQNANLPAPEDNNISLTQADNYNNHLENFDFINFVYEILLVDPVSTYDQLEFYNFIKKILEKNFDRRNEERIYKIFEEKICKDTKSCQILSIQAFESYLTIFVNINSRQNNLSFVQSAAQKDKYLVEVYSDPEKLIGFEILWKIVFDSFSPEIMNKGIETLHLLYAGVKTESNEENKENSNTRYTDLLLKKCLNIIEEVENETFSNNLSIEEKRNKIIKSLYFLKLIIEESEKKGTARIKSHSGLLKRKVITLKIDSHISKVNDFKIRIYANTTMWDLKELIGNKAGVSIDFINLILKTRDILPSENGMTVLEMGLTDGDEIRLLMNSADGYIRQAELTRNGKVVPELVAIYNSWFDTYSTENKQTRQDLARFIKAVTGTRETIDSNDQRINNLFASNDREGKGWIERQSFVGFYMDCTLNHSRKITIWENLHLMGIRNDLKRYDEPLEIYNSNKTVLPRYQLSHNQDFFKILLRLQDLDESIAKEAFKFLCTITTNPEIYKEILFLNEKNTLNNDNIYKLIYSLQIVESFIEDVEIESEGVDCFTIEEAILDLQNFNADEVKKRKIEWMEKFVKQGGFEQLVQILQTRLISSTGTLMSNICLELLIKIVRIFYNSSLSKYYFTKSYDANKNSIPSSILTKMFEGELGNKILHSLDYAKITENLLNLLNKLCIEDKNNTIEEINIIENSFEFIIGIIAFSNISEDPEISIIEKIVLNENFKKIYAYGIINQNSSIRDKFSSTFTRFFKIFENLKKYDFMMFLFKENFKIFDRLSKDNKQSSIDKNSNEFYEFFANLFEIYFCNIHNLDENLIKDLYFNPNEFVMKIAENLYKDLGSSLPIDNPDQISEVSLTNEQFIGNLKILTKVVQIVPEIKEQIVAKFNLIHIIMTKVLFKQTSNEMNERIAKMEFINPDKLDDDKNNRNTNSKCRIASYNFILSMLNNSLENFEYFFSLNVLESEKVNEELEEEVSSASRSANATSAVRSYYHSMISRREDHVGLRNLGCICYMNSMMQQFFMVPSFRYCVLQCNDNISENKSNTMNIDDNVLHQVQRMFTFLDLSQREDYNPQGFCYSFKDYDGNPTNTSIQQDSQEFLNRFFDKLEDCIKPTQFKYMMQSIFGGKTCSQLICEEGCGNVKNRFEDFYNLSLEVSNMKTLYDSLEKFISPERIDEYNCETCQKKVTITKRNSIAELPNVLIIHLQRIYYNYENDRNEKINTRLEFPRILNIKNFTIEELMRKNNAKRSGANRENNFENNDGDTEVNNSLYETDEIYFRQNEYYEYHLVGVNVHIGSADAGHYFSYINSTRFGKDNQLQYDSQNELHTNSWLKFNDSHISKFDVNKLEEECFGGSIGNDDNNYGGWTRVMDNSQSAYMLVYERRIKNPIKLIISTDTAKNRNLISFKQEETSKIRKQFDVARLNISGDSYNSKEVFLTNFYDNAKNENFKYIPFYSLERLIPRKYYQEASEDNSQFQKHQNILDEQFVTFFENVISVLDATISNAKDNKSANPSKISITLLHFIFNILNTKEKQKLLRPAIEKFSHIIEINKECLDSGLDYVLANINLVHKAIHNDEIDIVTANSGLLYDLIKRAYNLSPADFKNSFIKFKENNSDLEKNRNKMFLENNNTEVEKINTSDKAVKLCNYLIDLFPKISYKYINKISPLYSLIKNLALLGDEFVEYLFEKDAITRFITYLIGKESPCYNLFSGKYENWDLGRSGINNSEQLVNLIYYLYQKCEQYSTNVSTGGDEENNNIKLTDKVLFTLSQNDLNCLKATSFLKYCYNGNEELFLDLILTFSRDNEEFTMQSCEEITRYIDDLGFQSDNEFIKLTNMILQVVAIKDKYQLVRLESLIGFPVVIVDEPSMRSKWPIFGFNKLPDDSTKWMDYKSCFNTRGSSCLLKKLMQQRSKDKTTTEIYLLILNACISNHALLKFIRNMPSDEAQYDDFINWGVQTIHSFTNRCDNSKYLEKLKSIVEIINPILDSVLSDNSLIKNFTAFGNKYLPNDIKREEFSLLMQGQNLFILKIEYFTNHIPFSKNINFKRSASSFSSNMYDNISKEEKKVDSSQNITSDDNTIIIDISQRFSNEKEFLKKVIPDLIGNKKVVVQNPNFVENVTSTMIRYVIYNNSNLDGIVQIKFKRPKNNGKINEFIPNFMMLNINSYSYKNIVAILKINTSIDWTNSLNDLEYDVQVDWHKPNNSYGFSMYNPNVNSYNSSGQANLSGNKSKDFLNL